MYYEKVNFFLTFLTQEVWNLVEGFLVNLVLMVYDMRLMIVLLLILMVLGPHDPHPHACLFVFIMVPLYMFYSTPSNNDPWVDSIRPYIIIFL
jgi:hypothetical protein